ncbi:ThiF family adenylyltransferase [Xanthomonas hydrangeae]|uniref:ThiF family adenylyltransferase n=1 Tax=Xanthomonas hydrangeae TaxID=2775159 RepID=A0AAU0BE13_9XANT|nr:ThiF family adenylyltransferase [Xanthomonas hydrangeae]WOB51313.1 ThiF family adenylyltransferase [Xanthomonas hydrangeae]
MAYDLLNASVKEKSPVERGITALRTYLGDEGVSLLQPLIPKVGEAAAFRFPLPEDYAGVQRWLRIAFPTAFPRSALRLRVEPSPWLVWPHAMETGLCLHGFRQKPVTGTPETIVNDSLSRLRKIVGMSLPTADANHRKEEFQREAMSYWRLQQTQSTQGVTLLRRLSCSGELFAVTDPRMGRQQGSEAIWLSDDTVAIGKHLELAAGLRIKIRSPAKAAFYAKLKSYPDIKAPAPGELFAWLGPHLSKADNSKLLFWFGQSSSLASRWIALELPGDSGAPIYCINLRDRSLQKDRNSRLGVRAGRRLPSSSAQPSLLVRSAVINVLDRTEVFSRDLSSNLVALEKTHVVVVGQGSLGSPVALHLARAGVGNLTLIDPDELIASNLGRHVLGADELGQNKALAMRNRLHRDIAIVKVKAIPTHVELALFNEPDVFEQADLVIVTSADWESETTLWRIKSEGAKWALVQAWSEPHAIVGHALLAPTVKADARPLFMDDGTFRNKYTNWFKGDSVPLPACGQSFIPGGGLGMSSIASMVSGVVIRHLTSGTDGPLWISSINNPQSVNALHGEYVGPDFPKNTMEMTLERPWPRN